MEAKAGTASRRPDQQEPVRDETRHSSSSRRSPIPGAADDLGRLSARQRPAASRRRPDAFSDRRSGGLDALAVLAIFTRRPTCGDVRGRISGARDPRDVVGRLIGLIRKPFKYRYTPPAVPVRPASCSSRARNSISIASTTIRQSTPNRFRARLFAPSVPFDPYSVQNTMLAAMASAPQSFSVSSSRDDNHSAHVPGAVGAMSGIGMDPATNPFFGSRQWRRGKTRRSRVRSRPLRQDQLNLEQRMARDVQTIEMTNANIKLVNSRALPLLKSDSRQRHRRRARKVEGLVD